MDTTTTNHAPAAPCAINTPSLDVAARWPEPHEWPDNDAPAIDWARFYRDRFGARVIATPAEQDIQQYATWLYNQALRDRGEKIDGSQTPNDIRKLIRDDAFAEARGSSKGPIGHLLKAYKDRPINDAMLAAMFVGAGRDAYKTERGICILLGYGKIPLAQVDVDPRHGGDILGEFATLPGPATLTPGGGRHVFVMAAGVRTSNGRNALAPGVEVRTEGYAMVPSGASSARRVFAGRVESHGRSWVSTSAPCAAPAALCRGGVSARTARQRRDQNAAPTAPWEADAAGQHTADDIDAPGHVAHLLGAEVASGERNSSSVVIVGLLARPGALPPDAVSACLRLLVDFGAGNDWAAARIKEETDRWRTLLTRGPRDAEFAAEVLATWITTRDVSCIPWSASKARGLARSVWKTADRREEGRAGEEDMGHAGDIIERDTKPPSLAPAAPSLVTRGDGAPYVPPVIQAQPVEVDETSTAPGYIPLPGPPATAPPVECRYLGVEGADCKCDQCAAAKQAKRDAFLRRILQSSVDAYPDDAMDKDMERVPLKVETLYPFYDFWRVEDEAIANEHGGAPVGHGYGRWLARAIGGLLPGDFKVVGGAGAKIGKTHFLGQMIEGLALCAAARILGVLGYHDAPIVMPVWVTEMPKPGEVKMRLLSRHFGFDMAAITMAQAAAESPGIMHMASEHQCLPGVVVTHARAIVKAYRSNDKHPVGMVLKHLNKEIALSEFPAPSGAGRSYVDHSSGVNLISHLADAVALRRRELAALLGVPEDQVMPLVVIDPGQRFIGQSDSAKKELDTFLGAVSSKICRTYGGLGAIALMTSDTTKAAAKELNLDVFLSGQGQALAADIFAGSQAMMHIPDTVIALCGEESTVPYRRTQWGRVLQSRTGAPLEAYPFAWETHIGRFRPRKSEPLRAPPADRDRGGGRTVGEAGPRMPPLKATGRAAFGHPRDS